MLFIGFMTTYGVTPADAVAIRLGKAEVVAWEVSPGGVDATPTVDSAETFVFAGCAGTCMLVGGGTGKIDVGTVDPPYFIDGTTYSTYMASLIGVKEEMTDVVILEATTDPTLFVYIIDFAAAEQGSDFWLFKNIVDWGTNMKDLAVLVTAQSNAKVSYEKDAGNNRIVFYGSSAVEVSYRLTAPRFDHATWSNISANQGVGFVRTDTVLSGGALDLSGLTLDTDIAFGASLNFLNGSLVSAFSLVVDSSSSFDELKLTTASGVTPFKIDSFGNVILGTADTSTTIAGITKIDATALGAGNNNALCHLGLGGAGEVLGDCPGTPADIAEYYETDGTPQPGDVVALVTDTSLPRVSLTVRQAVVGEEKLAVGIISTLPTLVLGYLT